MNIIQFISIQIQVSLLPVIASEMYVEFLKSRIIWFLKYL